MAALTYAELSQFVYDVVSPSTNIGPIYKSPRDFRTESDVETYCTFGAPSHLNFWTIARPTFKNTLVLSDGRNVPIGGVGARIHTLELNGWYGYTEGDDVGSYTRIQDLLTSIMNNLQGKKSKAHIADSALALNTEEVICQFTLARFQDAYAAYHCNLGFVIEEMYAVPYM
jgi:hypothetical protein